MHGYARRHVARRSCARVSPHGCAGAGAAVLTSSIAVPSSRAVTTVTCTEPIAEPRGRTRSNAAGGDESSAALLLRQYGVCRVRTAARVAVIPPLKIESVAP